jgi:hypothetical protein
VTDNYVVVWSGEKEKREHDAQLRPAPPLPEPRGKTGHVQLRMDGGRRTEESIVDDLRERWTQNRN